MEAAKVYTQDGTVDLQGRPVLASKTGRWRACSFLLGDDSLDNGGNSKIPKTDMRKRDNLAKDLVQVPIAAFKNRKLQCPDDHLELYELDSHYYKSNGKHQVHHTPVFRFLDKAAIKTSSRVPCTITSKGGGKSWIGNNLNDSRLDYYYGFLVVISIVNMGLFVWAASKYVYKSDDDTKEFSRGCVQMEAKALDTSPLSI
ncbi:unnamed protein product [Arabidopsis thaliana]|uniref:(thale cress) hypothetical protein n=1 Tax=Arabidopsis thaliana TaxID=3702 RepID=A0A7G2EGA3_ARATH|nr:unnamed protein product [Arabidopsis thaliana]